MRQPNTDPSDEPADRSSGSRRRTDRRVQQAPVYLDRRAGDRRNGIIDRRSDEFERLYFERVAAVRAQISLLEQQPGA